MEKRQNIKTKSAFTPLFCYSCFLKLQVKSRLKTIIYFFYFFEKQDSSQLSQKFFFFLVFVNKKTNRNMMSWNLYKKIYLKINKKCHGTFNNELDSIKELIWLEKYSCYLIISNFLSFLVKYKHLLKKIP